MGVPLSPINQPILLRGTSMFARTVRKGTRPLGPRPIVLAAALWAFGVLPASLPAQTQSGSVTGSISDATTREPIAGARVFVPGTVTSASSRQDGSFRLQLVPGTHELRVTYIGYGIARDTVRVGPGESITRDFQLTREPLALQELAVIGTRAAERTSTEAPVPVDVLTAAEIKQSGRTETAQIIQSLAPS